MSRTCIPTLAILAGFILVIGCKKKNPVNPEPTPTPIPTATPTQTPIPNKRVFLTSTSQTPGSLLNADAICQTRAGVTSLGGTWKAWISDSTEHAKDRIADVGPWYLVGSGVKVANNIGDLIDGTLQNAIHRTEYGVTAGSVGVWTGTTPAGLVDSWHCVNWTDTGGVLNGNSGSSMSTTSTWTNSGGNLCFWLQRLYCFEQ